MALTDEQYMTEHHNRISAEESAYNTAVTGLKTALLADTGPLSFIVDALNARARMAQLSARDSQARYRTGTSNQLPVAYGADPVGLLVSVLHDIQQDARSELAAEIGS